MLDRGTCIPTLFDSAVIGRLDLSVVIVAFVDQFGDLGQTAALDRDGVSVHKPVDSFGTIRSSQRSLVVVDSGWG